MRPPAVRGRGASYAPGPGLRERGSRPRFGAFWKRPPLVVGIGASYAPGPGSWRARRIT